VVWPLEGVKSKSHFKVVPDTLTVNNSLIWHLTAKSHWSKKIAPTESYPKISPLARFARAV